jgi:hypothetical protein
MKKDISDLRENKKQDNKLFHKFLRLKKEDRNIEALIFLGALVEYAILSLIDYYEEKVNEAIKITGLDFKISDYKSAKQPKTLWPLKENLFLFIKNKTLKKELEYFIKLRNKCVHSLRDEDLDDLELNIKKDFPRFMKLYINLHEIGKKNILHALAEVKVKLKAIEILEKPGVKKVIVKTINGKQKLIAEK